MTTSNYTFPPQSLLPSYVLVTPAKNEGKYIEQTLKAMAEQTVKPKKWVIVSDGSTDNTAELVKEYSRKYDWIELVELPVRSERHFAGKVMAFNAGYERLTGIDYDIIGNMDGDVSFDKDYYQFLLGKFAENPALGVAGTDFLEEAKETPYNYKVTSLQDVAGACQVFRRKCFEDIGGYVPIKGGGIDSLAVYMARFKGWETRTYLEKKFLHLKQMWGGSGPHITSFIRTGKRDYNLGGHPLWQVFRSVYQMRNKPFIIGGVLILTGYLWQLVRNVERPVSPELIAFLRKEQMQRLKGLLSSLLLPGRGPTSSN
jgi:poly-beta-1,6-N-acetyl-D-glucosamine synthase